MVGACGRGYQGRPSSTGKPHLSLVTSPRNWSSNRSRHFTLLSLKSDTPDDAPTPVRTLTGHREHCLLGFEPRILSFLNNKVSGPPACRLLVHRRPTTNEASGTPAEEGGRRSRSTDYRRSHEESTTVVTGRRRRRQWSGRDTHIHKEIPEGHSCGQSLNPGSEEVILEEN